MDALIYSIHLILWRLLELLNGIWEQFYDIHRDSARMGRIRWRRKLYIYINTDPSDFFCFTYTSVKPDYVLKPNVSLYCVSRTEAVFVETPENINLYSSDENPFLYMAQFYRSTVVIRMPIETFHNLAGTIGDPRIPVIWITSTGRCGSTLLGQIFEAMTGTVTLAEPQAPQNVANLRKFDQINLAEYDSCLQSAVRMLCKPQPGTTMICIKGTPAAVSTMADISNLFPNFKHIFAYRTCLGTVSSWLGVMTSTSFNIALRASIDSEWFSSVVPIGRNHFINVLIDRANHAPRFSFKTNTVGLIVHMWANFIFIAKEAMSNNNSILPVKYEDMLSDPLATCSRLFQHMGLDQQHLEGVTDVFKRDSQRGSILSRGKIFDSSQRRVCPTDRTNANAILSLYGLPQLQEDFSL